MVTSGESFCSQLISWLHAETWMCVAERAMDMDGAQHNLCASAHRAVDNVGAVLRTATRAGFRSNDRHAHGGGVGLTGAL